MFMGNIQRRHDGDSLGNIAAGFLGDVMHFFIDEIHGGLKCCTLFGRTGNAVFLAKQNDIRQDRVEQAKQALAQGTHRKPEVVAELAERIGKFL